MARFVGIVASLCNGYTESTGSSHECQNAPNNASSYASVPPPGPERPFWKNLLQDFRWHYGQPTEVRRAFREAMGLDTEN
jgi:hypothetical protein